MSMDQNETLEGTPLIKPSSTDHPLHESIVEACRSVFDPEIPVNIFDLGLIYTIEISDEAIEPLPGVKQVDVDLTWEPPWGMDMMSDEARLELGFM